jgi:hypothetical protein
MNAAYVAQVSAAYSGRDRSVSYRDQSVIRPYKVLESGTLLGISHFDAMRRGTAHCPVLVGTHNSWKAA